MRKLFLKFGSAFMMLAITAAELNVNATCGHHIYQEAIPESARKLSKIK